MQTNYYQTFDGKIPNILQSNQKYLLQSTFCILVYIQPGQVLNRILHMISHDSLHNNYNYTGKTQEKRECHLKSLELDGLELLSKLSTMDIHKIIGIITEIGKIIGYYCFF